MEHMKMTTLYLDCEFNGHCGEFISIALYNPNGSQQFYAVCWDWQVYIKTGKLNTWVKENVIPKLLTNGKGHNQIVADLTLYLNAFEDDITIIADWPEDFVHLCNLLFRPSQGDIPPSKIIPKLKMELVTTPDKFESVNPHNAMADAEALYRNHMYMLKQTKIGENNDPAN